MRFLHLFTIFLIIVFSNQSQQQNFNITEVQISWEATPSSSSGLLHEMLSSPFSAKNDYLKLIFDLYLKRGFDIIENKTNLNLEKTIVGLSAWEGVIGAGAQTFTNAIIDKESNIDIQEKNKLNLFSAILGYLLTQDAVIWHYEMYNGNYSDYNGFRAIYKRSLTEKEFKKLYTYIYEHFNTWELAPGYLANGFFILNFVQGLSNENFQKGMLGILETKFSFNKIMIETKSFKSEGDYISNNWINSPDGQDYKNMILNLGNKKIWKWANEFKKEIMGFNRKFALSHNWLVPTKNY